MKNKKGTLAAQLFGRKIVIDDNIAEKLYVFKLYLLEDSRIDLNLTELIKFCVLYTDEYYPNHTSFYKNLFLRRKGFIPNE